MNCVHDAGNGFHMDGYRIPLTSRRNGAHRHHIAYPNAGSRIDCSPYLVSSMSADVYDRYTSRTRELQQRLRDATVDDEVRMVRVDGDRLTIVPLRRTCLAARAGGRRT